MIVSVTLGDKWYDEVQEPGGGSRLILRATQVVRYPVERERVLNNVSVLLKENGWVPIPQPRVKELDDFFPGDVEVLHPAISAWPSVAADRQFWGGVGAGMCLGIGATVLAGFVLVAFANAMGWLP